MNTARQRHALPEEQRQLIAGIVQKCYRGRLGAVRMAVVCKPLFGKNIDLVEGLRFAADVLEHEKQIESRNQQPTFRP